MNRKTLIEFLKSMVYPNNSNTSTSSITYQNEEGIFTAINREDLQSEFEKLLGEINDI